MSSQHQIEILSSSGHYPGTAFLAFGVALVVGHFAGGRGISGTPLGILLSITFFLLIALAVGSVIEIFFNRHQDI